MAIITVSELGAFMGRDFSSGQQTAASAIIDGVSAQIQSHLNRNDLDGGTATEEHTLQYEQSQVFLKNAPVTGVTAMSVTTFDGVTTDVLDPQEYVIFPWGLSGFRALGDGDVLTVTYTFSALDAVATAVIESVALSACSRAMGRHLVDAPGLSTLSVEGSGYTWGDETALTLSRAEKRALSRYRRKVWVG